MIWGLSFSAQRSGADALAPFTFYNFRNYFAVITMSIIMIFYHKKIDKAKVKDSIIQGIILGVVDFLALGFQQMGIGYTTASNSSFITATYVIMVPLIGILFGKKIKKSLWLCVLLEIIGLYFLCIKDSFILNKGDLLTFVGAIFFAVHIYLIEKIGERIDTILFCFVQYIVCSIISTSVMFIFESPINISGIKEALFALAYTGILSSAICVSIQVFVQKEVESTIASLIMCLESVFGAIGAWIILHETLSPTQLFGCGLAFIAIVISQLPQSNKLKKDNNK